MTSGFLDIYNKCRKPTVATLKEALKARASFSTSESNFITYIAGFSHYEFARKLFDEFSLEFLDNTSVLLDSINKKFHIKILITDQFNLEGLSSSHISETYKLPEFTNCLVWRNSDGSYIDSLYEEIKNLNLAQYNKYKFERRMGLQEDLLSYEIRKNGISFVIHLIKVWRNIDVNLQNIFDKVSIALFVNNYDDMPNLAIQKLRDRQDIHDLLSKIKWYVLDIEEPEKVTSLLEKVGAEYTLLPFKGEDYNYFNELISNIEVFMRQRCNNL